MAYKGISCFICVVLSLLLRCEIEAGISKISVKNAIEGKDEKYHNKIKLDFGKTTTAKTITTGSLTEIDATTISTLTVTPAEEEIKQLKQDFSTTTALINDIPSAAASTEPLEDSTTTEFNLDTTTPSTNLVISTTINTTTNTINTTSTTTTPATSQDDYTCSCGIFLSSQFVKGSPKPPTGEPVISTMLDHTFACNPIGQKKCQTKCLEYIVQHLPNSANILCASLDRDIKKERAYLFIKNCSTQWHNTNLAAGREYCCKNGQPYKCTK